MIINELTRYEMEVLGIEPDHPLLIDKDKDDYPYHRCFIRWGAGTGGGTLYEETAKSMTFSFSRKKDLVETHKWIGKHGISCVRLPGMRLMVKLPYYPYECCKTGGMWPPRKVSLRIKKKKFMTREEKRYWRRQWGSKSERERLFGSEESTRKRSSKSGGRKRRKRRRRRR